MGKTFGIFSGKGGVGKTVTALSLASAINGFGRDVLVIDANICSTKTSRPKKNSASLS